MAADALSHFFHVLRAQRAILAFDKASQEPACAVIHPALAVVAIHGLAFFLVAGTEVLMMEFLPFVHVANFLDPLGTRAGETADARVAAIGGDIHIMQGVGKLGADRVFAAQ